MSMVAFPVRRFRKFLAIAIRFVVLFCGLAIVLTRSISLPLSGGGAVAVGEGGAVASVDQRATQVGIDVLRSGGNAIDAAVAVAAALGVVEPFSGGIGGGGFMVIYLKQPNRVMTLDGRETAPATATVSMFTDPDSPTGEVLPFFPNRISNGAAVGVPGTVLTWQEALHRYGTLTLQQVLQPAIALAEQGFAITASLHEQIVDNQTRFAVFPATQQLYLPQGQPLAATARLRNPDLAKTYRLLAEQGVNPFYRGEIAAAIAHLVQRPQTVANPLFRVIAGGMTLADLDQYAVQVRPALPVQYHQYKLYSMGLPSSGGITAAEVLNIVSGLNLSGLDRVKAWHSIIEAERLAFADRNTYLGDPQYVDVPVAGLLSPAYAQARRALIGDRAPSEDKFPVPAGNPLPFQVDPSPSMTVSPPVVLSRSPEGLSTTHLSVCDRWGNLVSYTLTLESTGGSGMVVPGYGFLLNNELTDFDPVSPHPNAPEPGKRPRSSMAPTIMLTPTGDWLAYGSPGGATIITTVLGITLNLTDFGMNLVEAIEFPRLSQRNTGATQVEAGFASSGLGQGLTALGHRFSPTREIGAATGVMMQSDGRMTAVAEARRRGGGAAMVVHAR